MRDWAQENFPLELSLIREVFRDSAAMLGKADPNSDATDFAKKTIGSLNLDRPPLPARPNAERRTMFNNIIILLHRARTRVPTKYFSQKAWVEAHANKVLNTFVKQVVENQVKED